MINPRIVLSLIIAAVIMSCNSATKKKDESTSKTKEEATKTTDENIPIVVTADIETGIKTHIDEQVKKGNGYFHMKTEDDDELKLELVRVHTEYLANLGPGSHFACVDLADVSGDVYDVDFFLEGDPGDMNVTRTSLHKLNGKPFYTWKQHKDKTWHQIPVEQATSDLLGIIEGEDKFEFRYEVTLPKMKDDAKMWIPIPESDNFQTVELLSMDVPGKHKMIEEKEYGNTILYLEFNPEDSGEKVELVYNVERQEKNPYEESTYSEKYLNPSLLMPVGDRFKALSDSIIADKHNEGTLVQARALYDYIIDNMLYQKAGKYGTGDAVYACDALTGNCTEFHSLFISLARSANIPARFAIGAAVPSERDEGGIDGYHCWAEFYAEGKWWPVDISEANKYTALATYYFGRHPANRIEFSRGRDLVIEPGPSSGTINFLAYPVFEIGGSPAIADTFFSFNRKVDPKKITEVKGQ
ncbi:transglutaminase-like domain-containing protein [Galbibacter sp. EGI 63066]|uniref:transglutaminase-like domain-containing protein n=1 Tax=Galbibacter sp. EGI 63066 TaxID=2993559 RepID=UPI0022497412|nr:transglutaminase-like domain-containing protein [Galbibacter sp. EGI 63066]MCX2679251.1 transglutaminase-like domain-containing protein [Galbibacter sp. EGI 63066]